MKWQPIETAPKDGTFVLLYGGDWIFQAKWRNGEWYHAYYNDDEPTHWMRSPEMPE